MFEKITSQMKTVAMVVSVEFLASAVSVMADWSPQRPPAPQCVTDPSSPDFHPGCLPPLNQGDVTQRKEGALGIGGSFLVEGYSHFVENVGIGLSDTSAPAGSKLSVQGGITIVRPEGNLNVAGHALAFESYDAASVTEGPRTWVPNDPNPVSNSSGDTTPGGNPFGANPTLIYQCLPSDSGNTYIDIAQLGRPPGPPGPYYRSEVTCTSNTSSYFVRSNGGTLEFLNNAQNTNVALTQGGNLGVGVSAPTTKLQIGEAGGKLTSVGAASFWGSTGLYGTLTTWDTDGVFIGLKDNGVDHKDAQIIWGDNDDDLLKFTKQRWGAPAPAPVDIMSLSPNGNVTIGRNFDAYDLAWGTGGLNVDGQVKAGRFVDDDTNFYADLNAGANLGGDSVTGGAFRGSSLCIGADCRNAWPAGGGGGGSTLTIGSFAATHEDHSHAGNGSKTVTSMEWVRCSFKSRNQNGGSPPPPTYSFVTTGGATTGPAGSGCEASEYTAGTNRFVVGAFCPAGQKIVSGGGAGYRVLGDDRPTDILVSEPTTGAGFSMVSGTARASWGAAPGGTAEGWRVAVVNTDDYDGVSVYAMCAN